MSEMNVKVVIGAALSGSHTQALSTARKSIKEYATGVGAAVKQNKLLGTVMTRSEAQITRLKNRQQDLNKQLSESRGRWIALGAAIYGASRMIKAAAAIEEQGLYLRTVINAPDKDAAVGRAMSHARKFARGSLATENEVLDVEYQLNSAGLSEEVSRAGTELVHKLAYVTKGVPSEVGKIFATTFNNLGGSMEGTTEKKMDHIGDVLAKTQFFFQIDDFNQLGQSMSYASATIASAKVDFEQSAAALGVMNGAGLDGSRAGTAFAAVMRNMTKASDELGFSVVRGANGQMDLIATLEGMKASLDGLDIDERNDKLQELFDVQGKEGLIPLIEQLDKLKTGTDAVSNSAGTVGDSYKTFLSSTKGQMTMFSQNLKMVGNVIAGSVLPGLNLVLKPIGLLFGAIAWAIEKFPPLGWIIGGVTAAIIGVAAGTMVWTAAQWAQNAALFAWPGTWVIAGLIAVGLAIGALVKNWGAITGAIWGAIKAVFKWSPLGMLLRWKPVGQIFGALWRGIKLGAGAVWDVLKKVFSWTPLGLVIKHWGAIKKGLGSVWSWMKERLLEIGRIIKTVFDNSLLGKGIKAISWVGEKMDGLWRDNKGAVAGAAASVAVATTPLPAGALPAMASSGNTSNATINAPISIVQQPGQSGEELAVEIDRKLKERERKARSERNGRLYD
jgi:TP901 family phage tail tape measure protein